MKPLVTIIVPVYKAEDFIERCAISLFAQTYSNIEYYFVNDCTPDKSMELLKEVIDKFPARKDSVTIIDIEQNQGQAHAINVALKQCHGDYVICIDADDWVGIPMIEKMLDSALENDSDIVCCPFIIEEKDRSIVCKHEVKYLGREGLKNYRWDLNYSVYWNKLIRTSLIKDNNIYFIEGTSNWVDVGQVSLLRFIANKISYVNEYLYHYNRCNENSVSIHFTDKRVAEMIEVAKIVTEYISERSDGEYNKSLQFLRFLSKDPLLMPDRNEYSRWLSTFPECHRYIFSFPIPKVKKIQYWLKTKRLVRLSRYVGYIYTMYKRLNRWRKF